MIYLDSAATTLVKPKTVSDKVLWALTNLSSPGRGQYLNAELAEKTAFECREKTAALFNVKEPDDVVFTFNATHGLNMAIFTLARPNGRCVVSGFEHNAVMRPLKSRGMEIIKAESPLFDRESAVGAFDRAIDNSIDFVVCTAVSNVFGYILPIEEIAEICRKRRVPLIIDASQGAGTLDLDFTRLGAAFMAMPGHKGLYGPQGTGILLCGQKVRPLLMGGTGGDSRLPSMPDYLPDAGEAGTHNMVGIAGLSAGIDFVSKMTPGKILRHEQKLASVCAGGLRRIRGVNVYYTGDRNVQSGVLSFTAEGRDCEEIASELGKRGICVRAGLHCAPSAHETVGTLKKGTVRVSFSAFNSKKDVMRFLNTMGRILS